MIHPTPAKIYPQYVWTKDKCDGHRFIHMYIWVLLISSQVDKCNWCVYVVSMTLRIWIIVQMKHLENKMALFSIIWKKIIQTTHLLTCDGIDDTQMYMWINLRPLHFALAKIIFAWGRFCLVQRAMLLRVTSTFHDPRLIQILSCPHDKINNVLGVEHQLFFSIQKSQ